MSMLLHSTENDDFLHDLLKGIDMQLPLSNEFLMSLTSTWEPDTLKIP